MKLEQKREKEGLMGCVRLVEGNFGMRGGTQVADEGISIAAL